MPRHSLTNPQETLITKTQEIIDIEPIEIITNTPLGDTINISQDNKGDKLELIIRDKLELPRINKPQEVPENKN